MSSKTVIIALTSAAIIIMFQNCAKNPNLSQNNQQATSASTSSNGSSSGNSNSPGGTAPTLVTMEQAQFVQSNSASVTAAPGSNIDLAYNFSVPMPVPSNLTAAKVTQSIEAANGTIVASNSIPLVINVNVPVTNGEINQALASIISLPASTPPATYMVLLEFTDATGAPISMNAGSGVAADPNHAGFYQVGAITVSGPTVAAPTIITGPANATGSITKSGTGCNLNITFSPTQINFAVTASGTSLNYQWYFTSAAGTQTPIPGATASTYSFAFNSAAQAGTYTVVVSNSAGSKSSSATFTVSRTVTAYEAMRLATVCY